MEYNIREQIDTWQNRIAYFARKRASLERRIAEAENYRKEIARYPVGSLYVDRFYRNLNSLYTQLANLPGKIRYCKDNISTLECEL